MRDIHELFADYASHHQTRGNKLCHRVGIPLIVLSLLGLLARVPLWRLGDPSTPAGRFEMIDAGLVLVVLSFVFYLFVEWRLATMMLLVSVAFYLAGSWLPFWLDLLLFILGWIFQFIGHVKYEHRQPAFFRNLLHLLVGPLWILNDLVPVVK